ncbi:MAG: hypothetical protein LBU42_07980 [Prevotellaceae bacterium]|jgi:hypothetical protein|nr:hypothetical protein [Prevotellaceae bacterium]
MNNAQQTFDYPLSRAAAPSFGGGRGEVSLFFKEWIKSRWALLVTLLAFAGIIAYTFIYMSTELRVLGAGTVWESIIQKGVTHFDYLKYLCLLAGVLLAVVQYAPEMVNKRLKLTLHLPLPEYRIVLSMLLFGILSLAALFLLVYAAVGVGVNRYYPAEITQWNLAAILPWLWGGLAAYLLTAWIIIEPVWKQRLWNILMALCLLKLFYFDEIPNAYAPLLPYLITFCALGITFTFYSLIRFKDGVQ